uniref:Uncharacterized protein n=1 Tax=Rhizobium leguminosarum TaxID=384 RepID=A0A179BU13_RHILE|nr:hypothetical protein A4U53_18210 [Rhizobium leguminosarum]
MHPVLCRWRGLIATMFRKRELNMGLGRNLIQAVFLCGALAIPALARGAEVYADDALLTRFSIETVPRLQREYLRAPLSSSVGCLLEQLGSR